MGDDNGKGTTETIADEASADRRGSLRPIELLAQGGERLTSALR
jgi:hypothetical protein